MIKKIFLLLVLVLSQGALANNDTEQLIQRLAGISSYEADFMQDVQDSSGASIQTATGHMAVERPGNFYWYSSEPYEQELISDGDILWVYDRDLEQAIKKQLDKEVGNTPALLLSGNPENISNQFSVRREKIDDSEIFYLSPVSDSSLFDVMRVTFIQGVLIEMFLEDGLGQKTVIEFREPSVNQDIDGSIFRFNPPDNIDVISEF